MLETLLKDREELLRKGGSPHLSYNRVNRYLLCPEQYRLHYIENLRPRVPSGSLVFGQILHQALAGLFEKKADPVKSFADTWSVLNSVPLEYRHRETWDKLKSSGEALLAKFAAEEFPKIGVVKGVEKPFELAITSLDTPFVGILDLDAAVEGKSTVVDFKTAASAYEGSEVTLSDQLTAYKLARPDTERLALCILVKTKEPKIEWHFTDRTGAQLAEYLVKVGYVAREIAARRFYKRVGMWCAWCDFLHLCLGDHRKAGEALVRIA